MKRKFSTIFLSVLTVLGVLFISACNSCRSCDDEEEPPYVYTLAYALSDDESYYTVTEINGRKAEEVIIPSTYKDLPVKAIGDKAFEGCLHLKSLTMPTSITRVGKDAFNGCDKIITKNDGVLYVGNWAIGCENVQTATLKANTVGIADGAFSSNTSLTSITVNNDLTTVGANAFWGCTNLENVTLPASVTRVGEDAFDGCSKLLTTENGVQYVDKWVVGYDIEAQTSATLKADTVGIADGAFYLSKVEGVTLPATVTVIPYNAFYVCKNLTEINVADDNAQFSSVDGVLYNKNKSSLLFYPTGKVAESFTIPASVTTLGAYSFSYCKNLTSISIPETVTDIGMFAFEESSKIATITVGDNVKNIGRSAFVRCAELTKIHLGLGLEELGKDPFSGCNKLREITVAETHEKYSVVNGHLYNKDKSKLLQFTPGSTLTEFRIPETVSTIGAYAFSACNNLRSVTLPSNVKTIEEHAFSWCKNLGKIGEGQLTIRNGLQTIGDYAFFRCETLNHVLLPISVTTIGNFAFSNCENLTSINIGENVNTIGQRAFANDQRLVLINVATENKYFSSKDNTLYNKDQTKLIQYASGKAAERFEIPNSVMTIEESAFANTQHLKLVIIGSSVEKIEDKAFYQSSIESIVINKSVKDIGYATLANCNHLTNVYYSGTDSQWTSLLSDADVQAPVVTKVYYYNAQQPTASGNYWHYVDGTPQPW